TVETEAVETYFSELVVCLDAGPGGGDGGAVNSTNTRAEKDDNLALALATRDAFLKYPNVRVVMTRETDEFIELQERCDIANNNNANFFISLHRNSAESGNGVEIWINNDSGSENTWDKLMAEYIMDWLDHVGISERRGIHTGFRNSTVKHESNNYYVNRYTNMPSCLIEMGFMTSAVDNNNFDIHKEEYAEAIAGALIELLTDKGLYDPALEKMP
ncbi:MAG: N-acetylmuramoyl-L-alanine amidase, partial [Oscillospiraceae bacterium]|nr:N-acetylmuramoyl-L-alanine amidase [Oscillospiraceae bacterium]